MKNMSAERICTSAPLPFPTAVIRFTRTTASPASIQVESLGLKAVPRRDPAPEELVDAIGPAVGAAGWHPGHVELGLIVVWAQCGVPVGGAEGIVHVPHDLDVLIRHRLAPQPRSPAAPQPRSPAASRASARWRKYSTWRSLPSRIVQSSKKWISIGTPLSRSPPTSPAQYLAAGHRFPCKHCCRRPGFD